MAATGKPNGASSSSSAVKLRGFTFPPDSTSLSTDQLRYCTDAVKAFRDKLQLPQQIEKAFLTLQANTIRPSEMKIGCSVALDEVNKNKNRYTDVIPFDKNRVVLNPCKDDRPSARGYINASLIETSSESISGIIATQGPLPYTFEDFWEMIIQNRRRHVLVNWCCLCKSDSESVNHLLLHCPAVQTFWSLVLTTFGISWVAPATVPDFLIAWGGVRMDRERRRIWRLAPLVVMWVIWRLRNKQIFDGTRMSDSFVRGLVLQLIMEWRTLDPLVSVDALLDFLDSLS